MPITFSQSSLPNCKLAPLIFFVLLVAIFFQTPAFASSTIFNKLALPAIFFKSQQAFSNYSQAEAQKILAKIDQAVCLNDNTPLSLPAQDEVFPYLERAKIMDTPAKEQGYAIFIKFYLDFCITKRIDQEACMANSACSQKLCADYATPNHEKALETRDAATPKGAAGNLEEVYDLNARDLIAIP